MSRVRLEQSGADVVAYSTRDQPDMRGGLPQALLLACGEELRQALHGGLAQSSRDLGDIVWTPAFKLKPTRFVSHIIGVKADTPRGDFCQDPGRLEASVYQTLHLAEQAGAGVVAFANLSTGADRAPAQAMARGMLGPMRRYFREHPFSPLKVWVCLPDWQDYEAFQQVLSASP